MKIKQTSETMEIGIILALAGGFMDAYSYLQRGKVFANAQTGNMLLFGVTLFEGNYKQAILHGQPVIAFSVGIFLADLIRHLVSITEHRQNILHWRQISLIVEMIFLFVVCFIPQSHNLLANNLTSMGCGIQVESFRKIHGHGAATTMCIGNLRSATENLFTFLKSKKRIYLQKSLLYYFIIICFITGAITGNFFIKILGDKAMIICCLFLFLSFILMFKEEKKTIFNFDF